MFSSIEGDPGLDWLLQGLVERVPCARIAVLLSSDGLVKSVHGAGHDIADPLAAAASALYSLARGVGAQLGDDGDVRQVVAELDATTICISTAGTGARLLVAADRQVAAGVLGYEMATLIKSVHSHTATPARQQG